MGLRAASGRRPDAAVMAPALTETASQSDSFKFASSLSPPPKEEAIVMNGHPTVPGDKQHYNINGLLVKNLKNEFLALNGGGGAAAEEAASAPCANETGDLGVGYDEILLEAINTSNNLEDLFDVEMMNMVCGDGPVLPGDGPVIPSASSPSPRRWFAERIEESARRLQQVQQKTESMKRLTRRVVARNLSRHGAEEVRSVLQLAASTTQSPVPPLAQFIKHLEFATVRQAEALTKLTTNRSNTCRYFGSGSATAQATAASSSGSSSSTASGTASTPGAQPVSTNGIRNTTSATALPTLLPGFSEDVRQEIEVVGGELEAQLRLSRYELDSDATDSSSGGESADEMETYSNPHQQHLSINKRCLWRWAQERAAVASRWTWLQSQINDLDYKIRQQSDLRRQLRVNKGAVKLESLSSPNGQNEETDTCARVRPLVKSTFCKRRTYSLAGLHRTHKKLKTPTTLRCDCKNRTLTEVPACALCTGRANPTLPRDGLSEVGPLRERVALIDPGFHPVLSFSSDINQSFHYDALMRTNDWQVRAIRIQAKASSSNSSGGCEPIHDGRGRKPASIGLAGGGSVMPLNTAYAATTSAIPAASGSSVAASPTATSDTALDADRSKNALSALLHKKGKTVVKGKRGRKPLDRNMLPGSEHRSIGYLKRKSIGGDSSMTGGLAGSGDFGAGSTGLAAGSTTTAMTSLHPPGFHQYSYQGNSGGESEAYDSNIFRSASPVPSMSSSANSKDKDYYLLNRRKRESSYDIDNIVIPQSMAASSRVEKLFYKEIPTPKWRRVKVEDQLPENNEEVTHLPVEHKNGVVRRTSSQEGLFDCDDVYIARHEVCEQEERKKFLNYLKATGSAAGGGSGALGLSMAGQSGAMRGRPRGRTDSRAESSGPNTPDPMSPGTLSREGGDSVASPPSAPVEGGGAPCDANDVGGSAIGNRRRTVSSSKVSAPADFSPQLEVAPWEPLEFPLSEEEYQKLLQDCSVESERSGTTSIFEYSKINEMFLDGVESPRSVSTDSADSIGVMEDPNDPEWTSQSKRER